MKKTVYRCQTASGLDLEILLDANRELTEKDEFNLRTHADGMMKSIMEETINLDPESKKKAEKDKADIIALFSGREIFVEEIENGYCSDYCCKHLPWFVVTTVKGRIKIGWRKRVINITWDESTIEETAENLFPDEDVTKFDKTIHAWGYEKAKEYIDLLLK